MIDDKVEKKLQEFVEKEENEDKVDVGAEKNQVGPGLSDTPEPRLPHHKKEEQISMGNKIGWIEIPIKDLPTQGLFYPEGAKISIRAATANEIRHWSTIQESDISAIDDMMNYVIERCVSFKTASSHSSWKDIKEIDRFYVLLAIREFTFISGENNLQVKISESDKIDVNKNMIDYIQFDEKLMKYYDSNERCFVLKFKSGKVLNVTIPSTGVTGFIKSYIERKQQAQQLIDEDFITFAPFVIKDWRGLNDNTYTSMQEESYNWSIEEISVLTHLRDVFINTVNPVIKYTDEGGAERTVPLNFLGGIKSIFLISDPFGQLV